MSATADAVLDLNAVIAKAAQDALPPVAEEATDVPSESTDPDHSAASAAADLDGEDPQAVEAADPESEAIDAAEGEAAEDGAPSVELPDGYVAVPTVADQLATEFALYDGEGEVEIPALVVEYKANGKVRKDRLDQVVKLAQWGVYNEERDRKAQAIEQEYQQVAQTAKQLEAAIAEREAQMERLLNDEEFLYAVREAYAQENSPERQLARVEQEKENLRIGYEMQQITQQGQQFYTTEIVPAVQMITNALPNVTADEIESRLQMVMQAHAEAAPNGQPYVPPSRYDAIRQYIVEDLALWAQMVNAKRGQPANDQKKVIELELERARIEAQKAKNLVGRATKPTGQAARPSSKSAPKPATVDDAVNSALSTALASFTS